MYIYYHYDIQPRQPGMIIDYKLFIYMGGIPALLRIPVRQKIITLMFSDS